VRVNLMKRDEGSWRESPVTGTEPEIHRSGAAVSLALGIDPPEVFDREIGVRLTRGAVEAHYGATSYWARTPSATVAPGDTGLNLPSTNAGATRSMDYETVTVQSDFSTQFRALGMKHELVTGVEYLHEDSHRVGPQNLGGTTAASLPCAASTAKPAPRCA
jgi:catecholate siderophore receptor